MDFRIFIAVAVALVAVAFGGFYFALSSRSHEPLAATQQRPVRTAEAPAASGAPAQPLPVQPAQPAPPPAPSKATPESIEAEIAKSDHAELQALLKKHFADDYKALIAVAVDKRNEGASDQAFGQELFARFQDIMRSKLRFAAGASTQMIDRLAANEIALFRALGTEGPTFCLKVLGKDDSAADGQPPESVRRMMRLGTLYRFQAIVEGMSNTKPVEPLTNEELGQFEASLNRDGMRFEEVRSGAFLTKAGDELGRPCLMIEKLYQSIARLNEGTRRKIYAGMFFLGRDR
jgi:hypothetical protein